MVCLESHVGKLVWHLPVLNAVWQKSVHSSLPFVRDESKEDPSCVTFVYFTSILFLMTMRFVQFTG